MTGKHRDILIRTDGFYERGLGHIYRCTTLGRTLAAMPGLRVSFLTVEDHFSVESLRQVSPRVRTLPPWYPDRREQMLVQTVEVCDEIKPDVLFTDILDTPAWFMKDVKKCCGSVVCIDDLGAGGALADVVTGIDIEVCADTIPDEIRNSFQAAIHGGPRYCIIREDVLALRQEPAEKKYGGGKILVLFGGSDPQHATIIVLRSLLELKKESKITAVFGPCNRDFDEARELKEAFCGRLEILLKPPNLPRLMAGADVAICGVGNTLYEFLTLGVPCVIVSQAELQETFASRFDKYGCAVHAGRADRFDPSRLCGATEKLLTSREVWEKRSRAALELFDGCGTERIARLIKKFAEKRSG